MSWRSRHSRELSIRNIFLLLAILNGVVLCYLIYSAWSALQDSAAGQMHAHTTLFLAILLVIGVTISYRIVSQRVIRPLRRLAWESYAIAHQPSLEDDLVLNVEGSDEISSLTKAFNQVLRSQRDAIVQLDSANQKLRDVNRKVSDSIQYAALLQKSILPDRLIKERFGPDHFVLWMPRDTVGGDYYVFHDEGPCCLAGVADCAGHGVSGAMMTMLARAGIDRAIQQIGINSPAAVLNATNAGMSQVLSEARLSRTIATTMDMGLVFMDLESRQMRYAGARISLFWSDGTTVQCVRGGNRSLWDRRTCAYEDHLIPMDSGYTYYLATDGVFDQSGGEHGYGLGADRFRQWILEHATKPLPEQHEDFSKALAAFMGEFPQRDDITMLSFRVL
ncbi:MULTISPECIES: SpoIIE family protein phosphatase [Aphanothece]|uniref:SpoIIE family protein phosphatase n=1 Tax=Aphanothece TaxID=1121 RepID=UPI00398486AA